MRPSTTAESVIIASMPQSLPMTAVMLVATLYLLWAVRGQAPSGPIACVRAAAVGCAAIGVAFAFGEPAIAIAGLILAVGAWAFAVVAGSRE